MPAGSGGTTPLYPCEKGKNKAFQGDAPMGEKRDRFRGEGSTVSSNMSGATSSADEEKRKKRGHRSLTSLTKAVLRKSDIVSSENCESAHRPQRSNTIWYPCPKKRRNRPCDERFLKGPLFPRGGGSEPAWQRKTILKGGGVKSRGGSDTHPFYSRRKSIRASSVPTTFSVEEKERCQSRRFPVEDFVSPGGKQTTVKESPPVGKKGKPGYARLRKSFLMEKKKNTAWANCCRPLTEKDRTTPLP